MGGFRYIGGLDGHKAMVLTIQGKSEVFTILVDCHKLNFGQKLSASV